jgi:hypothetical protein
MKIRYFLFAGCTAALLSTGIAQAGPCDTTSSSTANSDAGSGPTPGHTAQTATTGAASRSQEHPPTSSMNSVASDTATSSEDAQRQMQGQPTAAQKAQGTKDKVGNDC